MVGLRFVPHGGGVKRRQMAQVSGIRFLAIITQMDGIMSTQDAQSSSKTLLLDVCWIRTASGDID
ncbi:MAG: hypothetical protein WCE82_12140 [Halobacteriota archaeon]